MSLNGNSDETNGYHTVIKNSEDNDANMVKAVLPPLGSIIAWLKSFTSVPSLPDGWVECNGQALSDADSPFNGETIPDLNGSSGDQRFLRGSTSSGTTGGEDTHTLTEAEMPAHTHVIQGTGAAGSGYNGFQWNTDNENNDGATDSTGSGDAHENRPPFYEVVWIMRVK